MNETGALLADAKLRVMSSVSFESYMQVNPEESSGDKMAC